MFMGYYTAELPKRRNGVIELTAYDDMVKLDVEFPTDYTFPQTFWAVYAQCVYEAGLADERGYSRYCGGEIHLGRAEQPESADKSGFRDKSARAEHIYGNIGIHLHRGQMVYLEIQLRQLRHSYGKR